MIDLDFKYLYPTSGNYGPIGEKGMPGLPFNFNENSYNDTTYEDHLDYLIHVYKFNLGEITSYIFKAIINEISLYNQNDENIFIRRVKDNSLYDPPFLFGNFSRTYLENNNILPIQFHIEEKMLKSKLDGKPIDVILKKYNI